MSTLMVYFTKRVLMCLEERVQAQLSDLRGLVMLKQMWVAAICGDQAETSTSWVRT